MSRETTRELVLIATHGKSQLHANVSPITFHIRDIHCLGLPKRLSEIWVRIFFNECAKFGGRHLGHRSGTRSCAFVRRDRKGRDSNEIRRDRVRIGRCDEDMWHNFCNERSGNYRTARLLQTARAPRQRRNAHRGSSVS